MIRVFVAIDFPKETKQEFADLVDSLVEDGYPLVFEKEENFHLTLKFLGWVKEKRIKEIEEAIKKAATGIKPFWFQPTKMGYFLKGSLILWLGASSQEGLRRLIENLEREMKKLGFEKEKREFTPHITLGRRRQATPPKHWRKVAEEIIQTPCPQFTKFEVSEIVLMESKLTPQGSTYKPWKFIPLDISSKK